jgi:hypothetical protein
LLRAGWVLETGPGQPLELVNGAERLNPGEVISRLAEEQETVQGWQATCDRLGIAGLRLAADQPAAQATAVPAASGQTR